MSSTQTTKPSPSTATAESLASRMYPAHAPQPAPKPAAPSGMDLLFLRQGAHQYAGK